MKRKIETTVNSKRIKVLHSFSNKNNNRPILAWMSRDIRYQDNHALLHAQQLARKFNTSFCVVFNIVPTFLNATKRHYMFMIKNLQITELL